MSRRFGRNQRRKLRDRLAQLETARQMETRLRLHVRRERDMLSKTLATVERALGQHFAALPPKTVRMRSSDARADVMNIPLEQRFDLQFSAAMQPVPVGLRCASVEAWLLHSDLEIDALRQQVHLVVSYEGANQPRAACFISESALTQMYPNDLAERLAPMLARSILDGLRMAAARA